MAPGGCCSHNLATNRSIKMLGFLATFEGKSGIELHGNTPSEAVDELNYLQPQQLILAKFTLSHGVEETD
jgi:hypothetical protein